MSARTPPCPLTRRLIALLLACIFSGPALAQGFAGLGRDAQGYALPDPSRALEFPRDHGPHPGFRIEWWYLTANLRGADGREYGVQWTLFRSALRPGDNAAKAVDWSSPQVWLGHAGLTTPERHFSAQRLARGGLGHAGARAAPFAAWIDDWEMVADAEGTGDPRPADPDALDRLDLRAAAPGFAFDLALRAEGPLVAHGQGGYSVKSAEGQASHYYSQPFYKVTGRLFLPPGAGAEGLAVEGTAWLDREWSSQPLSAGQEGWDWFSLGLEDGTKVMAFRLREAEGPGFTSATWITRDGQARPLPPGAIVMDPLEHTMIDGRRVPVAWRLRIAERGLDITTRPLNPESWMDVSPPYWEGPISFEGSHRGKGYLEMTGYGD